MINNIIDRLAWIFDSIVRFSARRAHLYRMRQYPGVNAAAVLGVGTNLNGPKNNFLIGKHTYINNGHLSCGPSSSVSIGIGCAIGYNVSIKAITHSKLKPTNNDDGPIIHVEKNIIIGNNCWIGDNVFIREGVTLGDDVVVGANSVVTKSFSSGKIIAGVPAREING